MTDLLDYLRCGVADRLTSGGRNEGYGHLALSSRVPRRYGHEPNEARSRVHRVRVKTQPIRPLQRPLPGSPPLLSDGAFSVSAFCVFIRYLVSAGSFVMHSVRHTYSVLVLAIACGSATLASAYTLPVEPFAPTSREECYRFYDQYQPILQSLRDEARQVGDEAWDVAVQSGSDKARPLYDRASALHSEHSRLLSEAANARNRCLSNVAARHRQSREEFLSTRQALRRTPGTYASNLASRVPDALRIPGASSFERLSSLRSAYGALQASSSRHDRLSDVVGIVLPKTAKHGGWNDFQTIMVESALSSVIEINKAATADFQAAMGKFNDAEALRQAAGFSRDVDLAASRQVQFVKGNVSTDFLQSDDLGQILEQARAAVDAMYEARREEFDNAVRQAKEAREARAKAQAAARKNNRPSHAKPSALTCEQIQSIVDQAHFRPTNCVWEREDHRY